MRNAIAGVLLGAAVWAGSPASLLAHGGHGGGHEGPFGVFHPIFESGSISVSVALVALIAGAAVVLVGRRSRT